MIKYTLSILLLIGLSFLQSCNPFAEDEDANCDLTGSPVTDATLTSGYDVNGNSHWIPTAEYKTPKGAELYWSLGSCGTDLTTNWEYTGDFEITSQDNRGGFSAIFYTSGTLCGQFVGYGKSTPMACQEIKVLNDNVWTTAGYEYPGEASIHGITLKLDGNVYSGFGNTNVWYKLDTVDFSWEEQANINSIDFTAYGGFSINDKGYIVGTNSKVYQYNTASNSWSAIGDFPVNVADYLQLSIISAQDYFYNILGTAVNGKGYFGLGLANRMWEFDPVANSWTERASYPRENEDTDIAFPYKGKIYVGNYIFDASVNTWTKNNVNFNVGEGIGSGFVEIDGLMYGGVGGKTTTYDGATLTAYEPRPKEPFEPFAPTTLSGIGVALGHVAIFPRPERHPSKYKITPTSEVSIYRK